MGLAVTGLTRTKRDREKEERQCLSHCLFLFAGMDLSRLLQALEVVAPSAKVSDVEGVFGGGGFDEETLDEGAVFEPESADGEWLGYAVDEGADGVGGEGPDFDFNAGAFEAGDADEAGFGWSGVFQSVELIVGMGAAGADKASAAVGELPVEWLAGEMGSDDGHQEAAAGGWRCG